MEPEIIYEDKNFLAVNKPSGLIVHKVIRSKAKGKKTGKKSRAQEVHTEEPTLVDWLLEWYPEIKNVGDEPALRPGIVHRLDKETSGVMLIPKNQEYFEYLKSLFKTRAIKKTYVAVVFGIPKEKEGIIDAPIGIKSGTLKRSVRSKKMAKQAVTEYKILKAMRRPGADGEENDFSLLEVSPRTGRTHQIRVHLASIGHPVVGDPLYGSKKQPKWAHRLMLHAQSLKFVVRPGNFIKIEAERPNFFG